MWRSRLAVFCRSTALLAAMDVWRQVNWRLTGGLLTFRPAVVSRIAGPRKILPQFGV